MVIDILGKVEEIVHVVAPSLLIDLVDEEASSPIFIIHSVRDDNDHFLHFFG